MTAYPDSSVTLRYILAGEIKIRHVLEFPRVISSELMEIECRRVTQRTFISTPAPGRSAWAFVWVETGGSMRKQPLRGLMP